MHEMDGRLHVRVPSTGAVTRAQNNDGENRGARRTGGTGERIWTSVRAARPECAAPGADSRDPAAYEPPVVVKFGSADAFGMDVDYAQQLIKVYGTDAESERRYSPVVCQSCTVREIQGSSPHVERAYRTPEATPLPFTVFS